MLLEKFSTLDQAYSGKSSVELQNELSTELKHNLEFDKIQPLSKVIELVGEKIVQHLINVNHPFCVAHLHCPPMIASVVAEVIIATTNPSMDSWDQSGAATLIEQHLVNWFAQKYSLGQHAEGVFTSGGTQSNFMGLLLARDYAAQHYFDYSVASQGLPPQAHKFRILCTHDTHFSILQTARLLGLGDQAVVSIPLDENQHLQPDAVTHCYQQLKKEGLLPIALVITAGTTDFAIISPLDRLGQCAKALGLWLHIDAAVGGALIFSQKHRHRLKGIEHADSLSIDFHKLFYQSISCSLFLLKDRKHFDLMKLNVNYLNPESNVEHALPDLVTKSVQTTRRFDALKVYITLQSCGQSILGEMIDYLIELATQTAQFINHLDNFELAAPASINTVVFRYHTEVPLGENIDEYIDLINDNIRLKFLKTGQAIIGYTKFKERSYLKFTFMNPSTSLNDIKILLKNIKKYDN